MPRIYKVMLNAVLSQLAAAWKEALSQLFGRSKLDPWFPPSVLQKLVREGISASDVLDVFRHGDTVPDKPGMLIRTYNGYKIGMTYSLLAIISLRIPWVLLLQELLSRRNNVHS